MDELLFPQSIASNICHEIANHLSIAKFLYDEIKEKAKKDGLLNMEDTEEIASSIEMLILLIDFYRNVYSSMEIKNHALSIVSRIYRIKNIKFSELSSKPSDSATGCVPEKIAAIILFSILKLCNEDIEIILDAPANNVVINIKKYSAQFEKDLDKFLNAPRTCDALNVLMYYAETLLKSERYSIKTDKIANNLRIIVWPQT
ncbi:MAG: hypothetical protein LBG13_00535 [Holosporales bacterium]|nr:hypothetical protein [Holosporales bacterium]